MRRLSLSLLLVSLLVAASVRAQQDADAVGERGSPRAAMESYLAACREKDYERAAQALELGKLSSGSPDGPTLARHLEVVLDQASAVDLDELSEDPAGRSDDGLPPRLDRVARVRSEAGEVALMMRRQGSGAEAEWRFSSPTVARIPALYEQFGFGALGELLPAGFQAKFLTLRLWQWAGLLLVILMAWLLSWFVVRLVYALLWPLVGVTKNTLDDKLLQMATGPMRLVAGVGLFAVGVLVLNLSSPAREFMQGLQRGLTVVALAWLFMRLVDIAGEMLAERLRKSGRQSALTVLPLGEKTVKVLVLGLALLMMLQNLGFNITGVLAGVGVGGLAIALAAQKTVENLFGGVSLIMDQPVRVGDFCKYGDRVGTVEDIGLRSTRIRSLDRTVVTVPNAEFAYLQLENFAPRDRILFNPKLGLRRDTTPDQLRWIVAELRKLLLSHPRTARDGHVRFTDCGDSSLDVEIFAYVETKDWEDFLAVKEDLLLRMLDIVATAGTALAVPMRINLAGRDPGPDPERLRAVETEVKAWRARHELPFPDWPAQAQRDFEGAVAWPPEGSAAQPAKDNGKSRRKKRES